MCAKELPKQMTASKPSPTPICCSTSLYSVSQLASSITEINKIVSWGKYQLWTGMIFQNFNLHFIIKQQNDKASNFVYVYLSMRLRLYVLSHLLFWGNTNKWLVNVVRYFNVKGYRHYYSNAKFYLYNSDVIGHILLYQNF